MPDARLDALARLFEPPKITHATVEYVDMPAISKENLRDPSYLASLRVVDAFAHVLRLFEDETVPHEKGSVDPLRDLEDVETELILSDLVVVEKRLERLDKDRKKIKNPELDREFELLEKCKAALEARPAAAPDGDRCRRGEAHPRLPVSFAEAHAVRAEPGRRRRRRSCTSASRNTAKARWRARKHYRRRPPCAAKSKPSWPNCRPKSSATIWPATGLQESGLERLISATYSLLGLMSFLTAGETEVPRLDHSHAQHRGEGRRRDPLGFREEVHPRRSGELEDRWSIWAAIPACAKRACCASKARSTSSRTATCW